MSDPYAALGITPNATDDEVTQAYRRLARHYHPDLNPGDKTAEQKMKEVNCAYEAIREMRKNGGASSAGGKRSAGSYYGSNESGYGYGQRGQSGQYGQNNQDENPFDGQWFWSFGDFGGYGQQGQKSAGNQQQPKPKQPISLFRLLIRFLIFQAIIMFLMRACWSGVYGGYFDGYGMNNHSGYAATQVTDSTAAPSAEAHVSFGE